MNKETHKDAIKSLETELKRMYISASIDFKHYALLTNRSTKIRRRELGSMTLNDWLAFLKDCDLTGANPRRKKITKRCSRVVPSSSFIRLN